MVVSFFVNVAALTHGGSYSTLQWLVWMLNIAAFCFFFSATTCSIWCVNGSSSVVVLLAAAAVVRCRCWHNGTLAKMETTMVLPWR